MLIKTFILHFVVVCTEVPNTCECPGLAHGGGGQLQLPGALDGGGGGSHKHRAWAGEECIESLLGGWAETFVLRLLPHGGGLDMSLD